VIGKRPGAEWTITLPAQQAFGPRRPERIVRIARSRLPSHTVIGIGIGNHVSIGRPDGKPIDATITQISEDTVTLDANHPLAGQDLIFDIELLEIIKHQRYTAPGA
jgi:peptidylprolyl isomerase